MTDEPTPLPLHFDLADYDIELVAVPPSPHVQRLLDMGEEFFQWASGKYGVEVAMRDPLVRLIREEGVRAMAVESSPKFLIRKKNRS